MSIDFQIDKSGDSGFEIKIDVAGIVMHDIRESGKELAEEIKKNFKEILKTGHVYADGWISENTPTGVKVYNDGKDASLGHLLENGHLAVDGSFVEPRPAIYPAREKIMNELTKKINQDL